MRAVHLYTGLFLAPWMIVYAVSGFLLNHGPWIRTNFSIQPPEWTLIREIEFQPDPEFPSERKAQAVALLRLAKLEGPHHIPGPPNDQTLTVIRQSGLGNYRVVWQRNLDLIRVTRQQPPSWMRFTHYLHFRHGYQQAYVTTLIWGGVVDAVVLSMVFWVVSGIYLWARRSGRRRLGGFFLLGGTGLFVVLVILLA